ncbi:MAG: hypothetical protein GY792_10015 [Gammaproteobacteria bacterium]|nr:hypothetical protein [Gammaproteobacteria bacterium]
MDKSIAGSLLTTAFPHSFTPYPHSAGERKEAILKCLRRNNNNFLFLNKALTYHFSIATILSK